MHTLCATIEQYAWYGAVRLMVSAADKPAEADLLWEKNIVPWLISQADKFKRDEIKELELL
jgi:hypothetical protein